MIGHDCCFDPQLSQSFYDNRSMRGLRMGCMWDPHRGNRRLLYDCVWLVSESQSKSKSCFRCALRATRSKFAFKDFACKLHLSIISFALYELIPSWLQVTKARVLRRLPHASVSTSCWRISLIPCGRNLTTRPGFAARSKAVLEDSNLVDPASSHMLVSKTKPCMSKYKCYTVKLRMAH